MKIRQLKLGDAVKRAAFPLEGAVMDYVYWPVRGFFVRNYKLVSRMIAYANFARQNEDYDYGYVWQLMEFKLKRLKYEIDNGYGIQEDDSKAALEEAIAICGRLGSDHAYEDLYDAMIEEEYGPYNMAVDFMDMKRTGVTQENEKQYVEDLMYSSKLAHEDWKADLNLFNRILKQHSKKWWD